MLYECKKKNIRRRYVKNITKDNADYNQENYDAKEKSNGEYLLTLKKKKKKQQEEEDGRVVIKQGGGFDVKI